MALKPAVGHEVAPATDTHAKAMLAAVEFGVDVAHEHGGVRVCPVGEIDIATVGRLRERISGAMAAGAKRVILDLRQTTFLDSTGLHLAVEAATLAARNGIDFAIIAGPPAVHRTFRIAGLSELPFVDVPRG